MISATAFWFLILVVAGVAAVAELVSRAQSRRMRQLAAKLGLYYERSDPHQLKLHAARLHLLDQGHSRSMGEVVFGHHQKYYTRIFGFTFRLGCGYDERACQYLAVLLELPATVQAHAALISNHWVFPTPSLPELRPPLTVELLPAQLDDRINVWARRTHGAAIQFFERKDVQELFSLTPSTVWELGGHELLLLRPLSRVRPDPAVMLDAACSFVNKLEAEEGV